MKEEENIDKNIHEKSLKCKNKTEIVGAFAIIIILVAMLLYSIFCLILSQLYKRQNVSVNIEYANLYPFENKQENVEKNKNILKKYKDKVKTTKERMERYTGTKLIGYEKLVENSYLYNNAIGYDLVINSPGSARVELEKGVFSILMSKRDIKECANRLVELKEYLQEMNADLLYVQAPCKISKKQKMSSIYKDYSNENMDQLLKEINGKVDYIDLRENIEKSNLNHLQLFYKTDHHWLPETGLWATGEISDYLNNRYNMNLVTENVKSENYKIQKFEKMYLGSDGRYVTLKNTEPEDFSLITPNFETKLSVKILDKEIDKTDTFENTLIDWSQLHYENYYNISQYSAYAYGDMPLIEIHNELVNNDKKILLIRDSFSCVVEPYLALENEYLSVIDLRYFDGSLKTYIKQFQPDLVIVLYYPDSIADVNEFLDVDDMPLVWNFE